VTYVIIKEESNLSFELFVQWRISIKSSTVRDSNKKKKKYYKARDFGADDDALVKPLPFSERAIRSGKYFVPKDFVRRAAVGTKPDTRRRPFAFERAFERLTRRKTC